MTRPTPRTTARPSTPRRGARTTVPSSRPRTRPALPSASTKGRGTSDVRRRADQPARSLSQRVRSTSSPRAASAAERKLREKSSRDSAARRPIKPGDVANRYRPGNGKRQPGARTETPTRTGPVKVGPKDKAAPVRAAGPSLRDVRGKGRVGATRGDRKPTTKAVDPNRRRTPVAKTPGARTRPGTVGKANRPTIRDRRQAERNLAPITARPGRSPIRAGARRPDRSARPVRPVGSAWRRSGRFHLNTGLFATTLGWNTWGGAYYGAPFGCWWNRPFFGGSYCWPATRWCNFGGFGLGIRYPWTWNIGGQACYWYTPSFGSSVNYIVIDDPTPEVIYVDAPQEPWVDPVQGEAIVPAAGDKAGWIDGAPAEGSKPLAPGVGGAPAATPQTSGSPSSVPQGLGTDSGLQRELNRASAYYLTQGDRSFRSGRYGDAAHYYAKSVEFAPDSGILYLVLSDALFATGDYRYAAYAIRQAADREPSLFENVIDKRDFYSDALDFESQLATLERFVGDHLLDMDARLVLATNYLFGGRAAEAVDLLENPFSEELLGSEGGKLMLAVAKEAIAPVEASSEQD